MIKHQRVLPFFAKMEEDTLPERNLGSVHFDNPSIYTSYEEIIFLMIQAAAAFIKSSHKPTLLQEDSLF